jgi:SAM-dependent methyltransferase
MKCPICNGANFKEFRGRPNAYCAGCGSTERARYVWRYLEKSKLVDEPKTVFHFGPERGIGNRIFEIVGARRYYPLDLHPEVFPHHEHPPLKFDILTDLPNEPDASVDLIIANHILEHLPCPVEWTLGEFNRILRPHGHMILTVPMYSNPKTIEDLSDLPRGERTKRFGQEDHFRIFGWSEFPSLLKRIFGQECRVDRTKTFSEAELIEAAVPYPEDRPNSNTIFHYQKKPRISTALRDRITSRQTQEELRD